MIIDTEIKYDRLTRDYSCYVDGRYVGSRPNGLAADALCRQVAADLIADGEALTAAELDAPIDIPDEEPPLTEGDPAPPPEVRACLSCGDLTTHPHFCQACLEAAEDRYILHQC